MEAQKQTRPLSEFHERCRQEGIPFTVQRRRVYEVLLGRTDHPTADQIFEAVQEDLPGISRMTVYRVLDLLLRLRLLKKVCHPEATARFDPNTEPHHHLVCTACGRLVDFEERRLDRLHAPAAAQEVGFHIDDHVVQFRGVCASCQANEKQRAGTKPSPCGRRAVREGARGAAAEGRARRGRGKENPQ